MPLDHEVVDLTNCSPRVRQAQTNNGPRPSSEDYNCPICLELLLEPVVGACGHEFCKDCYSQWLSRSRTYPNCPLCRVPLSTTIPGVSRRLADLIEASFPEKMKHRREIQEKDKQMDTAQLPAAGNLHAHAHSSSEGLNHSNWIHGDVPNIPSPFATNQANVYSLQPSFFATPPALQPLQASAFWVDGAARRSTYQQAILEADQVQQQSRAATPRAAQTAAHASSSDDNFEAQLRQQFRAWDAQTPEPYGQDQTPPDEGLSASDFSSSGEEDESDDDNQDRSAYPAQPVPFTAAQVEAVRAISLWPHLSPPQSPSHDSQRPRTRYQRPDSPYPFQELAAAQQQQDTHMLSASPSPAQMPHSARQAPNLVHTPPALHPSHLQGAMGSLSRSLGYVSPSAVPHAGNYMDFSGLRHSADRLAEASERLAVLAENSGQMTEQIAGMRGGGAFPASSSYAVHFSGHGSGIGPVHQPRTAAAAHPPNAVSLSNFLASAPNSSSSFAQGLPSPGSLPFTMGVEPQAPSWGSRARRARRVASASTNPPRFRNRMQQRRDHG